MRIYESVFEISEKFLSSNSPVIINEQGIIKLSKEMLENGIPKFPEKEITKNNLYKAVVQEFVGCAINYCYWYGLSTIRPNNCSSSLMYSLVEKAFEKYQDGENFEMCIINLIELLSLNRFPLLEEREKHLKELIVEGEDFCVDISNAIFYKEKDFYKYFRNMIKTFPGYASDIFLKRASLFFIQLYRQYGIFESAMNILHIPADYQIPKMLLGTYCIHYDYYLYKIIDREILIPKGSREECCIRAATIIACRKLQEKTGWNVSDVDAYLWLRRKEIQDPFHLCITTDY